jgi:hypothetical protein
MSLRTKKGLFWAKILINLEFQGQKLIKKKNDISGQKNKLRLNLRTKKKYVLGKNSDKS